MMASLFCGGVFFAEVGSLVFDGGGVMVERHFLTWWLMEGDSNVCLDRMPLGVCSAITGLPVWQILLGGLFIGVSRHDHNLATYHDNS